MASGEPLTFGSLAIEDWRQFDRVEFSFHDRLTVITGANAAGKTTLLNFLARHFGWENQLVGTPAKRRRGGPLSFLPGILRRARDLASNRDQVTIGNISYSNGGLCTLSVPGELGPNAAYQVSYDGLTSVAGLFIPSHRPAFTYSPVAQIPTAGLSREQILDQYLTELRVRATGGHTGYTPASRLKEALIAMATFGYGNQVVEEDHETVALYEGFVAVLSDVLPPSLGFQGLSIRMPEVVLETESGDFPLDAVSGGVAAIIDLAFQIYMRDSHHEKFVVVIDEPENHLHPELQRTLLPGFLEAFPAVQFIVATHSPFVVGSVEDSNVYVLRYEQIPDREAQWSNTPPGTRRVTALLLDTVNKAGTSNQILRDVLGLEATMPLWAERELERAVGRFLGEPVTPERIRELRSELARIGLADSLPETLERIVQDDSPA